jgi:hypothetical protein
MWKEVLFMVRKPACKLEVNEMSITPIRHVTDPTELTTAQLQREITNLKDIIDMRFSGHDSEAKLRQATVNEQFAGVDQRFNERDTRTDQTAKNDKVNLDAAFAAAKEAVGEQNKSSALAIAKSEAATNKQIDQVGSQLTVAVVSLTDKIDDTKSRMNTIESRMNLVAGRDSGIGLSIGGLVQAIASSASLAAIITFIVYAVTHHV